MPTVYIREDLAEKIVAKWIKEHPLEDNMKITQIMQRVGIEYINNKKEK